MISSRLISMMALGIMLGTCQLPGQYNIESFADLQIFGIATFQNRNKELKLNDVKGSPYLTEDFLEGKVLMGQTLYKGVQLRYNVYGDRFEARLDQSIIEVDPVTNPIDTLYFYGHKFVRKFLQSHKNKDLSHLAVLYSHPGCTLFKKYKVTLIPETKPGAYVEAQPAKFDPGLPDYYLGKGEELILLNGVKSIAEFFQVESKEVKSMIKTKQLKLQDEKNLIIICAYFSNQTTLRP